MCTSDGWLLGVGDGASALAHLWVEAPMSSGLRWPFRGNLGRDSDLVKVGARGGSGSYNNSHVVAGLSGTAFRGSMTRYHLGSEYENSKLYDVRLFCTLSRALANPGNIMHGYKSTVSEIPYDISKPALSCTTPLPPPFHDCNQRRSYHICTL